MKANRRDLVLIESKPSRKKLIQQTTPPTQPFKEDLEQLWQQIKNKIAGKQFSRHTKIRIQAWLQRLHRAEINKIWQQNRNVYLKLLNLMIDCEFICHPFLNFPPKDTLQIMQKHQVQQVINEVQKAVKLNKMQTRKHSHFAGIERTLYEMQNQKSIENHKQKSHINVSVSNDSLMTLSVSQQMRKQLTKIAKENCSLNKNTKPKFIQTTAPYKLQVNVLDFSFQTSKFVEPEASQESKIQKNYKKSSSLITEAINKQNNFKLISQQLKNYTDSLSVNPKQRSSFNHLLPFKKIKKQVFFKRSPRFNVSSNSWSERGEGNEKMFTDRKYWQSNSLAQVGTPRYLHFYSNHPYPSLILSTDQQEGISTTRSKQSWCNGCLFKIWPSS